MSKNVFSGLVAEKSTANVLLPGKEHTVRLMWAKSVNSFTNHKGAPVEKEHEWADATPQVLVQFQNSEGVFMSRFNMKGYEDYDDLDEKTIKEKNLVNGGGYACIVDKDGDNIRIESEKNTQACINIVQDFLYKLAGPDGKGDDIDKYIAEKRLIVMKLEIDPNPKGNGRSIVKYFREFTEEDAIAEFETASESAE